MAVLVAAPPITAKANKNTELQALLEPRKQSGFGRLEAVLLAMYALVLAYTVPYHEPWADEAQAWMIARDNSLWQIFRHRLHYEGSPPLWHFLLHGLHVLRVPWADVRWFAAALAVAGVYVWLRWSPLPLVVRALLPFTFFVQYQYAVVVRSYVLFGLLLFALCALYCARQPRVVWFAVVAGLLASLCMQGAVLSATIAVLYAFDLKRRGMFAGHVPVVTRGKVAAATSLLSVTWLLTVYPVIPAPDVTFAVGDQVAEGPAHRILLKLVGETPRSEPLPAPDYTPQQLHALELTHAAPKPAWRNAPRDWLAWQMRVPSELRSLPGPVADAVWPLIELPSEIFWAISTSSLLAVAFLACLVGWMKQRRALRYLLPAAALWLVGEFLWMADHHAGMLLLAIIAGMWLAAGRPWVEAETKGSVRLENAFLAVTVLVLALQVVWTARAVALDRGCSYDPSAETARYLRTLPATTRIAAFHFWAVGLQPYFAGNGFSNWSTSWWAWCRNLPVDGDHRKTIASHPEVVLYTVEYAQPDSMRNQILPLNMRTGYEPEDVILADLRLHGYHETHRFCGRRFARLSAAYEVCDVLFEPMATAKR